MTFLAVSVFGTLPAWLTLVAVAVASYVIWRGGGGTALATLQTANRILERRVHELEAQAKADTAKIAELTGRTDMALAMQPFMKWAETHETRAAERHDATVAVLGMIAARMGPDLEAGAAPRGSGQES